LTYPLRIGTPSVSPRSRRERLEAAWLRKLYRAQQTYGTALAETRRVQADLPSMSPEDAKLALQKALKDQSEAAAEYAKVLQAFTQLVLYGDKPEEATEI